MAGFLYTRWQHKAVLGGHLNFVLSGRIDRIQHWQESDPVRLLTQNCQSRTLRDVAQHLIGGAFTFESLTHSLGLPSSQHDPQWFETCLQIDRAFDFNRFGWLAVVAANDHERRQSPLGTFYLFGGVHKTLVLAKRLLQRETALSPSKRCTWTT
jgi:hypothetical protein